ncbi:MAG: hypothetical protein JXA58_08080, partial [Dehalococcoidia bacterium]|nr:hypothetical protein [Dehalococcoidia bacterium]
TREFRLRIKKAFDQEHIEIPWPHLKLYYGQSDNELTTVCPACQQPQPPGGSYCVHCGAALTQGTPSEESVKGPDHQDVPRT